MKRKQDAAAKAAKRIFSDLEGRRGIGHELAGCDDDIQAEILQMMIGIIREEIAKSMREEMGSLIMEIAESPPWKGPKK